MENFRLKVFRVVAELQNFRLAAEELCLTQPAITAHIKTLEEILGIGLFSRTGRNIRLTLAGETLLVYARQIEALTNQAVFSLAPFGAREDAELAIGASHTIAVYLLPKLLTRILKEWPNLQIHVIAGSTGEILQALTNHQVSMGLIDAPSFRPDLKVEQFAEDELKLIVPGHHPLAKRRSIDAVELAQERILLRESGSGMRQFVIAYLRLHRVPLHSHFSVDINSTEGLIAAVEAGLGVSFVPGVTAEKALQLGTVKAVNLENGPIQRPLSIALREGPHPQGPVARLIELFHDTRASGKASHT
jgi:DNA-binding transcriptional LysR family regulator